MSKRVHITQGEHAVGEGEDFVISTLLGSCVAVCLWDETSNCGGMNHMLLAASDTGNGMCNLPGINAMEVLINDIVKAGGIRSKLQAKVFGGARMVSGLSDIGERNANFAIEFLANEGITCLGTSIGGTQARNIKFWPSTGRALQRLTGGELPETVVTKVDEGNDLELF